MTAAARRRACLVAAAAGIAALLTGCGPDGLHGRFIAVDDTGLGDSSVNDTAVIVIPADAARDLVDGFSTDPFSLQNTSGSIQVADLIEAGGGRSITNARGRFTLDVEPGDDYVCYTRADPRADPVAVDVCGATTLPEDADLVLGIGESPFGVTVET